jgi:hypothetical protein
MDSSPSTSDTASYSDSGDEQEQVSVQEAERILDRIRIDKGSLDPTIEEDLKQFGRRGRRARRALRQTAARVREQEGQYTRRDACTAARALCR